MIVKLKNVNKRLKGIMQKPEWFYVALATVGSLGFVFLTPPFQAPDEAAHYIRVQYIANGYILPADSRNINEQSGISRSVEKVITETFSSSDLQGSSAVKYNANHIAIALGEGYSKDRSYRPPMISYSPIPYLPAIPGLVISNALGLSPLVGLYIARLSIAFATIAIMFLAIGRLPQKRYLLAAIGVVPMLLFQQSVVNADGVSYALLALFVAQIIRIYVLTKQHEKITNREWWLLVGLSASIVLCRPLLFLMLPAALILIGNRQSWKWLAISAVSAVIVAAGWASIIAGTSTAAVSGHTPDNVSPAGQIAYLEQQPKKVLRVAWNSYMTEYGDDEVRSVIGIFGSADTLYPLWMVIVFCCVLTIVAVVSFDSVFVSLSTAARVSLGLLGAVYFAAVNAAMYLYFTPTKFAIVYGVQGRYFLPILILFVAIVGKGLIVSKIQREKTRLYTSIALAGLVLLALFTVLQRFYLTTP